MKKKGFTLVELLAVIIILSLVLVIAVPSVNKYIKQSKEKAYNTQISTIIEAAQAYASANSGLLPRKEEFVVKITLGQLKSSGLIKEEVKNPNDDKYFDDALTIKIKKNKENYIYEVVENTITTRDGEEAPKITLNGSPMVIYNLNDTYNDLGVSATDSDGNALTNIVINKSNLVMSTEGIYQVKYTVTDTKGISSTVYRNVYVIKDKYANGTTIYFNPNSNSVCSKEEASINTSKSNGCMKWYSFLDDGSLYIKLILDHNTTAKVAWASKEDYIEAGGTEAEYGSVGNNSKGPITALKQLKSDTKAWKSSLNPRLIEASEIATITGYPNWNNNGYYFHDNTQTEYKGAAGTNKYAWLFDNTYKCTTYGCNVADSSTYGYWTNTAYSGSSGFAWFVSNEGSFYSTDVADSDFLGVRPVITVLKSKLR